MRIGQLAAAAGVNPKTVRYYESISLMHEPQRTSSGYRDYPSSALERLRFIRDSLDPSDCTDPNRCQVIDSHRHPTTQGTPTT